MSDGFVGRRFDRLEVVRFSHRDRRGNRFWTCRCDCGREKTTRQDHLLGGKVRSCGCYRMSMSWVSPTLDSLPQPAQPTSFANDGAKGGGGVPTEAEVEDYLRNGRRLCAWFWVWVRLNRDDVETCTNAPRPDEEFCQQCKAKIAKAASACGADYEKWDRLLRKFFRLGMGRGRRMDGAKDKTVVTDPQVLTMIDAIVNLTPSGDDQPGVGKQRREHHDPGADLNKDYTGASVETRAQRKYPKKAWRPRGWGEDWRRR